MDRHKLIQMLGLAHDATDEQINAALKGVASTANALQTANSAKADLEKQLNTANSQVQTLTGDLELAKTANADAIRERNTLQTANAALTTEIADVRKAFLDLAGKVGALTPAERADFETRLSTANSRGPALAEIIGATDKPARKAMNTQAVVIDGTRLDLSTANGRQDALQDAVAKRIKADGCDYDTAYARVKKDPNFAALFAAMQDPAKAKA